MSEIIRVPNFSAINLQETSILDADALAAQAQATIVNDITFTVGAKVVIGTLAQETAEVATIQSLASKVITFTANLNNKHLRGEPITQLFGDRIRLYRATNVDGNIPADSAFSYLSIYAIIQGDESTSELTDPDGGAGYWYKTTYYNTATGAETSLALSVPVRGGGYGKLVSIESIRTESGLLDNQNIDDGKFAERRDQAEAEVLGALAAAGYTLPLQSASGTLYTPALVENITRLLAAGYMMLQEYGPPAEGETNAGQAKVKEARQLLKQIQKQELVLLDITGVPMVRTAQVAGWPDDTTATVGTDGVNGEPYQMTMSKRF
jgi:hypothetical protein